MKKKIDIKKIGNDIKKGLKKTKLKLEKIGKGTSLFAKRSERELSKIARAGKAEIDILNLNIKKNRLYYQIGKKVYQLDAQGKLTTGNLKKLCDKIGPIEKGLKAKKRSAARYLKKKT